VTAGMGRSLLFLYRLFAPLLVKSEVEKLPFHDHYRLFGDLFYPPLGALGGKSDFMWLKVQ